MHVPRSRLFRRAWRPLLGALTAGSALFGCDKASDPAPVALDELKFAFGLKTLDLGSGTIRLKWTGVNNEDDFSGYNIYGVKENDAIARLEGSAIKLLDDKGEVDATGKATLGKMGYNGKDWETLGPSTNEDGDFAVYPYYRSINEKDKNAVLPSCFPGTSTAGPDGVLCEAVTAEGNTGIFNGQTYFDVTGLSIGSTYCFTVLATLDSGKKAAATTSEVRCVVPRASVTTSDLRAVQGNNMKVDLAGLRAACSTSGGASCGALSTSEDTSGASNCALDTSFCLEYLGRTGAPKELYFTASGHSGIQDLGYFEQGLSDPLLPKIPNISLNTLQNLDGYSLQGQSLPVVANHIYVVADGEKDAPTSFYYHLIHVKSVDNPNRQAAVEIRISNKVDAP